MIAGRSRPLFGSAIVVAAMLLSACYDGDADSPDTSRGAQATTAAAAPAAVQAVSAPATTLPRVYPDGIVVARIGKDSSPGAHGTVEVNGDVRRLSSMLSKAELL